PQFVGRRGNLTQRPNRFSSESQLNGDAVSCRLGFFLVLPIKKPFRWTNSLQTHPRIARCHHHTIEMGQLRPSVAQETRIQCWNSNTSLLNVLEYNRPSHCSCKM